MSNAERSSRSWPLTFGEHLARFRERIRTGDYTDVTGRLPGYYNRIYLMTAARPEPSYIVYQGPFDVLAYRVFTDPETARAAFLDETERYIRWMKHRAHYHPHAL